jgi:hypothetical protein
MRSHILSKMMLLGVGGGIAAYVYGKRARADRTDPHDELDLSDAQDTTDPYERAEPTVIPNSMDIDPLDPVQGLDEVQSFHVEELGFDAMAETDIQQDMVIEETVSSHGNDEQTMDEGQNWVEALESSAIENGAEPEEELDDIVDDEDIYAAPHAGDSRDTPVADRGSGGPGGI